MYSFGVLMLELITAKQPVEMGMYIVREVKTLINKNDKKVLRLNEDDCSSLEKPSQLVWIWKVSRARHGIAQK